MFDSKKIINNHREGRSFSFPADAPFPQVPAAQEVVYKASIDLETIWQRINKTGE